MSAHHHHQHSASSRSHHNSHSAHHYDSAGGGSNSLRNSKDYQQQQHSASNRSALSRDLFLKYRNEERFKDPESVHECFKIFDKNNNGYLTKDEFEECLKALFSFNGNPYTIPANRVQSIFDYFDSSKKRKITFEDFDRFWHKLVKQTLFPKTALVIVDVQNDFIDGPLALRNCPARQEGSEVISYINHLIDTVPFDIIVYTLDWHPANHCSFIDNVHRFPLGKESPKKDNIKVHDVVIFAEYPDIEQKLWPAHCIQNSPGAALHPDLKVVDEATDPMRREVVYVKKGCQADVDSYSAFFDNCKLPETSLNSDLKKHGVTEIYVCGLAADVCVAATSFDGLSLNYRVAFVEDASRGIVHEDIEKQKRRLINHGAIVVQSHQILNMIQCRDRRPEFAYLTLGLDDN